MTSSLVQQRKLVKSKSGLRIVSISTEQESPFELCEPPWTPDKESPDCIKCHAKFDFLNRRHHCRRCGQVYCGNCCGKRLPLRRMCFVDPVRICDDCMSVTVKENEFYEKHLKVLVNGATFLFSVSPDTEAADLLSYTCKLSQDHRSIVLDAGNSTKPLEIPLGNVVSLKILRSSGRFPVSDGGEGTISGVLLGYKAPNENQSIIHLGVAPVPNQNQSIQWLIALQKAIRMIKTADQSP